MPAAQPAHRADHRDLHVQQQRDQPVGLRRQPALDAAAARPRRPGSLREHDVEPRAEVITHRGEQDHAYRFVAARRRRPRR